MNKLSFALALLVFSLQTSQSFGDDWAQREEVRQLRAEIAALRQGQNPFAGVIEKAIPTVVRVIIKVKNKYQDGAKEITEETGGAGSGFIVDAEKGIIVTNAHVVSPIGRNGYHQGKNEEGNVVTYEVLSSKLTISLQDQTKEYPAQLIDFNEEEDLALIKIPNEDRPSNLKAAILKKSKDWKVGDRVVAYGAPRSLPGTLTSGIISHTGRTYWDSPFNDYIQTDTDSNPGNSGGPLINLDGEVIGVMTFGQTPISKKEVVKGSIGLNFAISVNHVIDLIERYSLRGFVHYVSLGLNVEPLRHGGLLVKSIIPGSPADKLLTVMPGDIITRVNNTSFLLEYHDGFDSSTIIRSYKVSVAAMKPGDLASLSIIRGSIANPDKVEVTMPVY